MCIEFTGNFRRWLLGLALVGSASGYAEEATIAAASNFSLAANQLVEVYEAETGHELSLVFGSSGRFFAQISNGAPFDVFLSADQEKPQALIANNYAVAQSLRTYAIGSLVLWSSDGELVNESYEVLDSDRYARLAIANSRVAPYGIAAEEVLNNLDLITAVQSRLVRGENISQTYQFVSTGNAELGFVARSQVYRDKELISGSAWDVPTTIHSPIRQDAVLLTRAQTNVAAIAFMEFLLSSTGKEIIQSFGYDVVD